MTDTWLGGQLVLHEPAARVRDLYKESCSDAASAAGREIRERDWSLADIYRDLGGDGPRSSELHELFRDFFNGQTRSAIAPRRDDSKLEYWAGVPERGAQLRDRALEILRQRRAVVGDIDRVYRGRCRPRELGMDAETQALVLAYNQIDMELYAHFCGLAHFASPEAGQWARSALHARGDPPREEAGGARPQGERAVCVLGMSRSGTSLTAQVLNVLGVDLGAPEELMKPAEGNNPAGFWEHEGIAGLNEDILLSLGSAERQGWRHPPELPEGWERDARLERHRREAEAMLRESFADSPLWGWKDPRNCLTLPFWQQLVPEMRYVICVRNPLDVAASLGARDGMRREESLRLWLLYMSQALRHVAGRPRLFVAYEDYFAGLNRQLERLAGFLGIPGLSHAQRDEIAERLDPGLRHQRESERASEESLPRDVTELYATLSAGTRD